MNSELKDGCRNGNERKIGITVDTWTAEIGKRVSYPEELRFYNEVLMRRWGPFHVAVWGQTYEI